MEDLILDAADRPLDPARALALETHLADCPDCRAFQAAQHRLEAALSAALPPRVLSGAFKAGLRTLPAREPVVPALTDDSPKREFWRHLATHSLPQGMNLFAGSLTAITVLWFAADSLPSDFLQAPALVAQLSNPWLAGIISAGAIVAGMGFAFRGRLQTHFY
jgi:anti-sigma factor RsiW